MNIDEVILYGDRRGFEVKFVRSGAKGRRGKVLGMTIFASVHGTIPGGILDIASLGIGLSVREAKGVI